jgi:tRNA(Ile)-lysidine synthase
LPAKKSGLPADPIHALAAASSKTPEAAAKDFLNRIGKPAHILVAISGGSDSTGLLVALARGLQGLSNPAILLSAATVDHGLREEAAAEAVCVASLCGKLGIAHRTLRWDGDKPASGIMAAAREARYGLLADAAADISADMIVTAHTFDDQQETLVMRSARRNPRDGATGTGIADALLFDRRVWILRPFLGCRRDDIRDYLRREAIGWIDDPSNEDLHYERVRVRKQLARQPALDSPRRDEGENIRAALSAAAAEWMKTYVRVHNGALCEIRPEGLAVDAKVLSYGLSGLAAVFGGQAFFLGRDSMARILEFLAEGKPGRRTAAGVVFDLRRQGLFLMRESRGIMPLTVAAGATGVWDGRFLIANKGAGDILVEAAGERDGPIFSPDLPKGAVHRAAAAMPIIRTGEGKTIPLGSRDAELSPYFAPFDRFLTRFDLAFAARLAFSFARKAYLSLPLEELLTENASGGADCLGNDTA